MPSVTKSRMLAVFAVLVCQSPFRSISRATDWEHPEHSCTEHRVEAEFDTLIPRLCGCHSLRSSIPQLQKVRSYWKLNEPHLLFMTSFIHSLSPARCAVRTQLRRILLLQNLTYERVSQNPVTISVGNDLRYTGSSRGACPVLTTLWGENLSLIPPRPLLVQLQGQSLLSSNQWQDKRTLSSAAPQEV